MSQASNSPDKVAPAPRSAGWRRLSGHAMIYVGASVAGALVPFLILPLMTRWLGPSDYGIVAGFLALLNVALLFVGLSTHGLINVTYYHDGPRAMPSQVGTCFVVMALTAVPLLAVLYAFSGIIERVIGVPPTWLWTIWLAACGQFAVLIALAVWQTLQKPFRFAVTQLSTALLTSGASVALIGFAHMGWEGRALGQAAGAGVMAMAAAGVLTMTRNVDWRRATMQMKPTLQFGLGLLPHAIGAVVMASVDRFALGATVSTTATGQYFAAFQISSILTALASAFNAAWNPWLYERLARATEEALGHVVIATYVVAGLLLAGAIFFAVLAAPIVRIVAGPGYEPAGDLLRYLAPAAAFGGIYYLLSGYAFYTRRTGALSAVTISVAAVQTALSFGLAYVAGARGVAIATLFSMLLYVVATWILAEALVPMPWRLRRAHA